MPDGRYCGAADYYDKIDILSPTKAWAAECNRGEPWKDISIVARVTHHGKSFVFGGDAESPAWENMMAYPVVKSKLKGTMVLKAAHHGRVSG